jgi:hypothetical protein
MDQGSLRLTARRRFAQFMITKPATVELDGVAVGSARWGRAEDFPVDAGRHVLTVCFPYFGRKRTGVASVELEVGEGQMIDVLYRSPWVVTNHGSLVVA